MLEHGWIADGGTALLNIWPPALPDELRRAVEADVGERGYSHVCRSPSSGAVLLTGALDLRVWRGSGDTVSFTYDNVSVRKRRLKWFVDTCEPPVAPDGGAAVEAAAGGAPPPIAPPLVHSHSVDSDFADRVQRLCARPAIPADWGKAEGLTATEASVVQAATPRAHPADIGERALPVAPEAPTARAAPSAPARLARDAGPVGPAADPAPGQPAHGQTAPAQPAVTERGVVMSVLEPVGYVRLSSRDVLVAVRADTPVAVGALVDVETTLIDGRLEARVVAVSDVPQAVPEPGRRP